MLDKTTPANAQSGLDCLFQCHSLTMCVKSAIVFFTKACASNGNSMFVFQSIRRQQLRTFLFQQRVHFPQQLRGLLRFTEGNHHTRQPARRKRVWIAISVELEPGMSLVASSKSEEGFIG